MKALNEMNNTERAYILAKMFPEHLEELVKFIKSEIEHFKEKEEAVRKAWAKDFMATAGYWYMLVDNAEITVRRFNVSLHKSPRIFADQFFFSQNGVFAIHCLIRFAGSGLASYKMHLAIELLFGDEQVTTLEFKSKEDENTK